MNFRNLIWTSQGKFHPQSFACWGTTPNPLVPWGPVTPWCKRSPQIGHLLTGNKKNTLGFSNLNRVSKHSWIASRDVTQKGVLSQLSLLQAAEDNIILTKVLFSACIWNNPAVTRWPYSSSKLLPVILVFGFQHQHSQVMPVAPFTNMV